MLGRMAALPETTSAPSLRETPPAPSGGDAAERRVHARVGDTVVAADGALGRVDRVISLESSTPVFLVVAVGRLVRRRYPVLPWSLVRAVDRARRRVYVDGHGSSLARLSESVPIVL